MKKEEVDHPDHYRASTGHEVIDVIEAWGLGFHLGSVVKYIARAGHKKDLVTDLKKARWLLDREIERLQKEIAQDPNAPPAVTRFDHRVADLGAGIAMWRVDWVLGNTPVYGIINESRGISLTDAKLSAAQMIREYGGQYGDRPVTIRRTFGNGKPINSVPDARGKIRDTGPTTCAIDWDETLERNPQSPDPTKQAVIDLKERGKIGDVLVQWAVTWIEDSDDEDVDDTKDAKIDIYCVVGLSSKNRPQVRRFRHRTYAEAVREWRTDSSRIPLGGPRAEQIAEQVREKLEALKADPAFPVR